MFGLSKPMDKEGRVSVDVKVLLSQDVQQVVTLYLSLTPLDLLDKIISTEF